MNVELILRVNGREVAQINDVIPTEAALPLENRVEQLKNRAGQVLLELGCQELAASLRHPAAVGGPWKIAASGR